MILVEHLVRAIRSTLGGDPNPYLDTLRIINQAGRHLSYMHAWRFLHGAEQSLATLDGVDHIALPTDWSAMVGGRFPIVPTDRTTSTFEFTTLDRLNLARQNATENTETYWMGAVQWRDGVSGFGNSTPEVPDTNQLWPCLALYPTPSDDDDSKFTMFYIRRWVDQTSGEGQITWPDYMELPLVRACMLLARGLEDDLDNPIATEQLLAAIDASPEMRAAKKADGRQQSILGRMQGGAVSRRLHTHFLATKVPPPS